MLFRNEAPGVHRIEDANTNWFLVEEGDAICVVDTGQPGSWTSLQAALRELGRKPTDIAAVVLTHGHFDHVGFARRAQEELGVDVYAPERERPVVAHPWRYDHERPRAPYLRHPYFVRSLAAMTAMGALWVKGVERIRPYADRERLDVPGHPQVVATPGHTHGHCSLVLADRGTVLVGDAFVMRDPYTGREGPCVVAGAATADSRRALDSLTALEPLEAELALSGHGPPWRGSLREAVSQARQAGAA